MHDSMTQHSLSTMKNWWRTPDPKLFKQI